MLQFYIRVKPHRFISICWQWTTKFASGHKILPFQTTNNRLWILLQILCHHHTVEDHYPKSRNILRNVLILKLNQYHCREQKHKRQQITQSFHKANIKYIQLVCSVKSFLGCRCHQVLQALQGLYESLPPTCQGTSLLYKINRK